jgi:hypothetical protein
LGNVGENICGTHKKEIAVGAQKKGFSGVRMGETDVMRRLVAKRNAIRKTVA